MEQILVESGENGLQFKVESIAMEAEDKEAKAGGLKVNWEERGRQLRESGLDGQ